MKLFLIALLFAIVCVGWSASIQQSTVSDPVSSPTRPSATAPCPTLPGSNFNGFQFIQCVTFSNRYPIKGATKTFGNLGDCQQFCAGSNTTYFAFKNCGECFCSNSTLEGRHNHLDTKSSCNLYFKGNGMGSYYSAAVYLTSKSNYC